MATIRDLIIEGRNRLSDGSSARLEAELLLGLAMGVSRSHLFAYPEAEVKPDAFARFQALIERRGCGEPMAYISGEREFWSLKLEVNPAVLIPRPETEILVEAALDRIPKDANFRLADLGTGSGAIALALGSERPGCTVFATDTSENALAVAQGNAERLGLGNVRFQHGSWFEPLAGTFDLIASNPPYVAAGDRHLEEGDLRFEPGAALVSGPDGLEALQTIVAGAPALLNPDGWLLVEHGHSQGNACRALFEDHGFDSIETLRDLEGSDRVSLGRNHPPAV
jgi:release factor glutamine methyltransferase